MEYPPFLIGDPLVGHSHHHEDDGSYYMEQVCTVTISALLGLVGVLLYTSGRVSLMLAPALHWTVLAGGITLLVLAAVQAVAVWVKMARAKPVAHDHDHDHEHCHEHDHDHGHAHDHEHGHCDHDHAHDHGPAVAGAHTHEHHHASAAEEEHDHGHEHGWAPWRYVVLMIPVVLFFLNLPNEGFRVLDRADAKDLDASKREVEDKGFIGELGFTELAGAVNDPDRRKLYEGSTVTIKGQVSPSPNDHIFSLVRFKMRCCAADAVPLDAFIMIDPDTPAQQFDVTPDKLQGKWVEVRGQVQFRTRQRNGQPEAVAVIFVRPGKDRKLSELVRVLSKTEQPPQFLTFRPSAGGMTRL
jgi:hypothetical protein